jgi:hypothetical protein
MLTHIQPSSAMAIGFLTVCLILMFGFEATNGVHETGNAVPTVIYTNALHPTQAVVWPAARICSRFWSVAMPSPARLSICRRGTRPQLIASSSGWPLQPRASIVRVA